MYTIKDIKNDRFLINEYFHVVSVLSSLSRRQLYLQVRKDNKWYNLIKNSGNYEQVISMYDHLTMLVKTAGGNIK